jgi:hypothetical protein
MLDEMNQLRMEKLSPASPAVPAKPAKKHLLNWDDVSEAATLANKAFGQWMPEQWVQAFVKAYNKE